jgi:heme-degrading monooxygenase HmoA
MTDYVTITEISVPDDGSEALAEAFRQRLGAVDAWPGFRGLTVLRECGRADRFLMITRWESSESFRLYMRSALHRASHARIPRGPAGPRPSGFRDFDLVTT